MPDDIEELAIVLHLVSPDERVALEERVPRRQVGEYLRGQLRNSQADLDQRFVERFRL